MKTVRFQSLRVVDAIGYLPVSRTGAMALLRALVAPLRARQHDPDVEQGLRRVGEWFGDDVITAALIDGSCITITW